MAAAVLCTCLMAAQDFGTPPPSSNRSAVLTSAQRASSWARAHLPTWDKGSCGWTRSTYMLGVWQYFAATAANNSRPGEEFSPDFAARDDVADWGAANTYQLCTGASSWTGPCALNASSSRNASRSCADNQLPGATYLELYKAGLDRPVAHSPHTVAPLTAEFDTEIALGSAAFGSWPVVDLTFMAMAPLARLAALTGDARYYEKMWANFNSSFLAPRHSGSSSSSSSTHSTFGLWNATERLFMRDDVHLWDKGFWGRGNGWAMLALVDAIQYGAGGTAFAPDPHRHKYVAIYKLFAGRLVELQGADGAWRSSMLEGSSRFPSPETTASACFTRGLAFGVNAGLLDERSVVPAVQRAWDFLSRTALHPSGQVGFCQGPGGGPTNDFNASSFSDFCVGMFLGAAAEVSRMA